MIDYQNYYKSLDIFGFPEYEMNIFGDVRVVETGLTKAQVKGLYGYQLKSSITHKEYYFSIINHIGELFYNEKHIFGPYMNKILEVKQFKNYEQEEIALCCEHLDNDRNMYITRYGELWKDKPIRKLILCVNRDGYYAISIPKCYNGGNTCLTFRIHRLVAYHFCPKPEHLKDISYEELQVNHKDGNKRNNNWWNLEWCTRKENVIHSYALGLNKPHGKYSPEQIKQLNDLFNQHLPLKEIAKITNMSYIAIQNLRSSRQKIYQPFWTKENWKKLPRLITLQMAAEIEKDILTTSMTRAQIREKYKISPRSFVDFLRKRKELREIINERSF